MANVNPLQLINMVKNGNPQQIIEKLIQENYPNDPTMNSLLQMGRNGDRQGLEQFAKQYLGSQGLDFNKELGALMDLLRK